MTLPHELERARVLTDRLFGAVRQAKHLKLQRVSIPLDEAEELLQLLSDSLRTVKEFDLVEFDGKIKPRPTTNRIGHNKKSGN